MREDLFYRLGMFGVPIPPLRERAADIVPQSETFLQEIGKSFGRTSASLTRDARTALLEYDWPGNVRELRNAWSGQRLSVMARSSTRTIWPSIRPPPIPRGYDRFGRRRTHHDCEGLERVPRQQNAGGTAPWTDTHPASPSDSKVPTRGSCRVIAGHARRSLDCNGQRTTEDTMTNEDNTADVRISNWTLATGTKPGARDVCSPTTRDTTRRTETEAKSS